mmetsp:Transcript_97037/g.313343  ORF Transcript_97037/g.313343 Transcript_97037/m.313343 type:complete len:274 (-) Transcript_97037:143-964(-)
MPPACNEACSSACGSSGRCSGSMSSPRAVSHQTRRCCEPFWKARSSTALSQRLGRGAAASAPSAPGRVRSTASRAAAQPSSGVRAQTSSRRSMSRSRARRAVSLDTAISRKLMRRESFHRQSATLKPLPSSTATRFELAFVPKSCTTASAIAETTNWTTPSFRAAQKAVRAGSSSGTKTSCTCVSTDMKSRIKASCGCSRRKVGMPNLCSVARCRWSCCSSASLCTSHCGRPAISRGTYQSRTCGGSVSTLRRPPDLGPASAGALARRPSKNK